MKIETILGYARMGWWVFPCQSGMKIPLTTHGVNDATCDEETILAWNTRWPDANWALACGMGHGPYVVDVDVDEEKGVDGWASLKDLPELPATVRQNTPRGGAHFLFYTENPPRNKNSLFPGIDIRAKGYYIMLPPSIHPNGKEYAWADGMAPGEIAMAEFPDAFRPPPPKKSAMPWETTSKTAKTASPLPASTPIIDRARLYLSACEPATQGQAGHDKLLWAARALVVGFDLDDSTSISLLWEDFNPRCNPPWNRETEAKDFERKVAEARRTPGTKPFGWLLDDLGLREDRNALVEYGKSLAESLLASVEPTPPEILIPSVMAKITKNAADWRKDILSPPGYVGDLVEWMIATAPRPQPKLATVAAIVGAGALFGGKVRDFSNGRTNLYGIGVAETSAGKDRPFKCIEELFYAAGAGALLGGGRVTSDTAIELGLQNNRTQIWGIDEIGDYFQGIKRSGAGAGGAAHLSTIIPCFKQVWSCGSCTYRGKQKADGDFRTIIEPHACLWGLTTPGKFYKGFSSDELEDGFMPRILIAISSDIPPIRMVEYTEPPEKLITITQAWFNRVIQPAEYAGGDILRASMSNQIMVETEPRARQIFENFGRLCDKIREEGRLNDDRTRHLWGKAYENARRVALTIASGDGWDSIRITGFHAEYACNLIKQIASDVIVSIMENMSDSVHEEEKKRIVSIISKAGAQGMKYGELTNRTQNIRDAKTRDTYVNDLCEANILVHGIHPDHPKCKKGWLWKYPYGLTQKGEKE